MTVKPREARDAPQSVAAEQALLGPYFTTATPMIALPISSSRTTSSTLCTRRSSPRWPRCLPRTGR